MNAMKLVVVLAILLVGCSTNEPLRVGVGAIEGGRIFFNYGNDGATEMMPSVACEHGECVVIKIEEFEQLLKRCKMKR
jgi:hypothetical protein